jgi:hypothetical protein
MVTIDSIHEKKFVSLDSVLQVVILSVHLLPGTLSLSLSLSLPSHHPSGKTHPLLSILQVHEKPHLTSCAAFRYHMHEHQGMHSSSIGTCCHVKLVANVVGMSL